VQMEGRCAEPIREGGADALLPATSCPKLPPVSFGYQRVTPFRVDGSEGVVDLPGYEGFDERVRTMAASPPQAIDSTLVDLFDVNADGLPDILVTDPARYGGEHGAFLNGASGHRDRFSSVQTVPVDRSCGADANVIKLSNPNVSIFDVDGDGRAD